MGSRYAASIPIRLLENLSGKKVLDLCAAPCKNTSACFSRSECNRGGYFSESIRIIEENLERCRLKANIVESDAFNIIDKFDIVLLDALAVQLEQLGVILT